MPFKKYIEARCERCMVLFMTRQAPSSRNRFCSTVCSCAATRERKLVERKQISIEFSERNPPPIGCAWVTVLVEKGKFIFALVDADRYDELSETLWGLSTQGYVTVSLKGGAQQALHHVVIERPDGRLVVDHINRDKLDNRCSNLRVATHARNCANAHRPPGATTPYRGVRLVRGRWTARIAVDGARLWLGAFDSAIEAATAYDEAAKIHHGEFASLNFPEDGAE